MRAGTISGAAMRRQHGVTLRLVAGVLMAGGGGLIADFGGRAAPAALPLLWLSVPVFVWGCWGYAKQRGYPGYVGLLGVGGVVGLIIIALLPRRNKEDAGRRAEPSRS